MCCQQGASFPFRVTPSKTLATQLSPVCGLWCTTCSSKDSASCDSLQEDVYSNEQAAVQMGVTPFAAYSVFSSVFLKDGDNLYVCPSPSTLDPR